MEKNWIELEKKIGNFEEMELWEARAHHNGQIIEGYALCSPDTCDWYDGMPGRDLSDDDLPGGLRLPAYMPGHKPEEE